MISKLIDAVNQMSIWSFKNIKGQGLSFTFVQGHSDSTFFKVIFLRNRYADWNQISYEASVEWVQMDYVALPRWLPCPYMVKTVLIRELVFKRFIIGLHLIDKPSSMS